MIDHSRCHRVTTIEGRDVCSCSEAWREHCEALGISRMLIEVDKQLRITGIEKSRGRKVANRLRDLIAMIEQEISCESTGGA